MPPKKSGKSSAASTPPIAVNPIHSFDNILVYYGHGAMVVDKRQTETFVVPKGRCFVTIVDAGVSAFAFQQKAFHKLCKLATTAKASGREAHTWLSNPIVYKAEIENYMDWAGERPEGTTQLHIAYGDFAEEDLRRTPQFLGQSFIDDTSVVKQRDGSDRYYMTICKGGLYFLENAGKGNYEVVDRVSEDGDVTEDEVLSVYDGSVFPTVYDIVEAKVKSQEDQPAEWVGETAFHTQWEDAINQNDDLHIGHDKVLDLLNEKEGRGVFYNLACRVVMDGQVVGARTRSIVGAVANLEGKAALAVASHVAVVNEKGTVARRRKAENEAAAEKAAAAAEAKATAAAAAAANKARFEEEQAMSLGVTIAVYRKWITMRENDEEAATEYITNQMKKAESKKGRRGGTRRPYKDNSRRTRKCHG